MRGFYAFQIGVAGAVLLAALVLGFGRVGFTLGAAAVCCVVVIVNGIRELRDEPP